LQFCIHLTIDWQRYDDIGECLAAEAAALQGGSIHEAVCVSTGHCHTQTMLKLLLLLLLQFEGCMQAVTLLAAFKLPPWSTHQCLCPWLRVPCVGLQCAFHSSPAT
jgi:hypothetical protein